MAVARLKRRLLYALATSDGFERVVRGVPAVEGVTYARARRYVAGRNFYDAAAVVERLKAEGVAASIDFLGEQISDSDDAARATDEYVSLGQRLGGLPSETFIAVDLSHIGLDVSPYFCRSQLERIAEALPSGRRLDIGAEDSSRTDAILDVVVQLARAGVPVEMTVQANLRRSGDDWPRLVAAGAEIRLVKGAYVEPPEIAYRYGDETDVAFIRLAHLLHEAGARIALATHDPVLREALLASLGPVPVEMLLGVRRDDIRSLTERGVPTRLYVPYGGAWFRYWMRRLAEAQGA
jgi:proline dehydrogenase